RPAFPAGRAGGAGGKSCPSFAPGEKPPPPDGRPFPSVRMPDRGTAVAWRRRCAQVQEHRKQPLSGGRYFGDLKSRRERSRRAGRSPSSPETLDLGEDLLQATQDGGVGGVAVQQMGEGGDQVTGQVAGARL